MRAMKCDGQEDPWVLVKDESELRAGMVVQIRSCSACGKRDTFFIAAGPFPADPISYDHTGAPVTAPTSIAWLVSGGCLCLSQRKTTIDVTCRSVYRLSDSSLSSDSESAEITRELERTR